MEIKTHVLTTEQPALREDTPEAAARRENARGNIGAVGSVKVADDDVRSGDVVDLSDCTVPKPTSADNGKILTANGVGGMSWEVAPDPSGKADKVHDATAGNFAGLDENGNLTDSGKAIEKFVTGVKVGPNGEVNEPDPSGVIQIPSGTTVNDGTLTINVAGTEKTFTANQAGDTTVEIPWKEAAAAGDAISLVKTGEKYNWNSKYDKPSGGIPKTDLKSDVQTSLGKADTAYQKPQDGIPKTDLKSDVQTSLSKADTAYQKPSSGIPKSDLETSVQTSLGKADSALQQHQDVSGKADRVSGAVEDHFAALDANGNLKDSGKNASSFATPDDIPSTYLESADVSQDGKTLTLRPHTGNNIVFNGGECPIEHITVDGSEVEPVNKTVDIDLSGKIDKIENAHGGAFAMQGQDGSLVNTNLTPDDIKLKQDPVNDPESTGNGLAFIASITQAATGVITPVKNTVQDGTTSQKGVVQLEDSHTSTSTEKAATPKNVKEAYDLANSKQDPLVFEGTYNETTNKVATESTVADAIDDLDAEITSNDGTNVQVKVTERDGKITEVSITSDTTLNASDIAGKADKVSGATANNFAGLDGNGNLTDSGAKASDFKTKQTAVTDPSASGTSYSFIDYIEQNENGEINPTKKSVPEASYDTTATPTTYANGLMTGQEKEKLDGIAPNSEVNVIEGVKLDGASYPLPLDNSKVATIPNAVAADTTGATNGLMTAADKKTLDGIESGAEVNAIETITVNNHATTIDQNRNVDIYVPDAAKNGKLTITVGNDSPVEFTANQADNDPKTVNIPYTNKDTSGSTPVYTGGLMTAAQNEKLDGIEDSADENVIESISADGVALSPVNKNVDIPAAAKDTSGSTPVYTGGLMTAAQNEKLDKIAAGAEVNAIESISANGTPLSPVNKNVDIPLATYNETTETYTDGLMTGQEKAKLANLKNFSTVVVGAGASATQLDATGTADTLTILPGNNVVLTPDTTNKSITISAIGGGSGTGSVGYYGSLCNVANVASTPVDLLDASATPTIDSQNSRFLVRLNPSDNKTYLYALKTVPNLVDPSLSIQGVDVFTLSYNVEVDRTQLNGFYGMAGVKVLRDSNSTVVLNASTESYPSQVGKCSLHGTTTIWNNAGNETTINGLVYYGYRLIYDGDVSTGNTDIINLIARFTAVEDMSGVAEYTGTVAAYTGNGAIDVDQQNNEIAVKPGRGLTINTNNDTLEVNLAPNGGLEFTNDGGTSVYLKLSDVTEEVISAVNEMQNDLGTKITNNYPPSMITQSNVSVASGDTQIQSGYGILIGNLFTCPITHKIFIDNTHIGVYCYQNDNSSRAMLGVYEYDPDGNNGTGQTTALFDTGIIVPLTGYNEYPVKHVFNNDDTTCKMRPGCMYYAAIFMGSDRTCGNDGMRFATAPGYNLQFNNLNPVLTVSQNHIPAGLLQSYSDDLTFNDFGFSWYYDDYNTKQSSTTVNYHEAFNTPRFYMQIRNRALPSNN